MTKAEIKYLQNMLEEINAQISSVEELHDKYEEEYDNRSERWQESEKGEAFYEMVENLDSLMQSLDEARDYLEDILND